MSDQIAAQLRDELGGIARSLAVLAGPDATLTWPAAIDGRVNGLAADLTSTDDRIAAQAVTDVMAVLWPHGDTDPAWWPTPLGRAVARSIGRDGSEAVTYSIAAAMLGVAPGTVSSMVARSTAGKGGGGGLERHPDGGVTRSSVLARLAR